MQHETAASFMIEHGLEPLEQYPGAAKLWRCRCLACGDEVRPRYANIKQGWDGCGRCGRLAQSRTQRPDCGLPFSTWSLAKLAEFLVAEGVVDDISHEGLRVLLREGVSFQRLKPARPPPIRTMR